MTPAQRNRCFALLRSAGDVWAAILELNSWRRRRGDAPRASYQELCRELAVAGPGTFGELDTTGARSVLRRFSDAWFVAAKRRKAGDRSIPYPSEQVRSVTLVEDRGRLYVDVTAEVPVAAHAPGSEPDPARVAGVDLGIIHPHAAVGPEGQAMRISGRAIRAEHRMHLADSKGRQRAAAGRAPKPGQRGSRRWRHHRRRARRVEGRHGRRVRKALHEAAKMLVAWAVEHRIGTRTVGDPRTF